MRHACNGLLLLTLLTPLLLTPTGCGSPNNQDLIEAAETGDTAAVQALLDAGADIHATNNRGETALRIAAFWGETATVQALLDASADVNATDNAGETALMVATMWGHTEIVEILRDAGAN